MRCSTPSRQWRNAVGAKQKIEVAKLFDYLTTGGILEVNPAASVHGPKYVVKRGKTPVLSAEEARKLIDAMKAIL